MKSDGLPPTEQMIGFIDSTAIRTTHEILEYWEIEIKPPPSVNFYGVGGRYSGNTLSEAIRKAVAAVYAVAVQKHAESL